VLKQDHHRLLPPFHSTFMLPPCPFPLLLFISTCKYPSVFQRQK